MPIKIIKSIYIGELIRNDYPCEPKLWPIYFVSVANFP